MPSDMHDGIDFAGEWIGAAFVMDEIIPATRPVLAEWLDGLARSDAELAAGLMVPTSTVHRRIGKCVGRMAARRAGAEDGRAMGDQSLPDGSEIWWLDAATWVAARVINAGSRVVRRVAMAEWSSIFPPFGELTNSTPNYLAARTAGW